MSESNVIKFTQPGAFTDSLTAILRSGARALLTQAVEAEVAEFLAKHTDLKTETGQQRVVRHGHLPEREIMTGIGPVQRLAIRRRVVVHLLAQFVAPTLSPTTGCRSEARCTRIWCVRPVSMRTSSSVNFPYFESIRCCDA